MIDIVLLGATGYTGRLCASYMAQVLPGNVSWALAGRNKRKLQVLHKELQLEEPKCSVYVLDLTSHEAISELVKTSRVIVNTIGHYAITCGTAVIKACTENGTDYVDWGVLPPPNAFDVQTVDELGVLVESTHAEIEEAVIGRSWGLYADHGPGFLSPDGYGEDFFFSSRMQCSNALSALMFRTSLSLVTYAITKIPPIRYLTARMFSPGTGPSEEARRSHYFKYRTLAIADSKGAEPVPKVEVKFAYGGDPYVFTGVVLTQAALVLLQGVNPARKRGGILTPAALGEEFVTRLKEPEADVEIEVEVLAEQLDRVKEDSLLYRFHVQIYATNNTT
ncbi:hypothetical protein F52700_12951 [Fusarium sp. NRRL 52700]|nr:hypothetical protein F52700_12951 [Fusarium sp. NRRL 52700]